MTSLEEQYASADNLRARIALHQRFSTNPYPYPRGVFDGYDFGPDADVGGAPAPDARWTPHRRP